MNKKFIISLIAVLAISVVILVKQSHIFFKEKTTDDKPTVKIIENGKIVDIED